MKKISLIPGTFNPLHDGHLAIAKYVINQYEVVQFLVSVNPYDKDGANIPNYTDRAAKIRQLGFYVDATNDRTLAGQVVSVYNYYIREGALDIDLNFTLNIGIDTFERFQSMKYYQSELAFDCALENMLSHGLSLIRVFPRNGKQNCEVHPVLTKYDLVEFVEDFEEVNISSTELRNEAARTIF